MKTRTILMVFCMLFALVAGTAMGGTLVTNTSLAAPGVYFGSGNPNTNWTVYTEGNLELGQSAINRFGAGPAVIEVGSTYYTALGATPDPKGGSAWGVALSANANLNGTNGKLSDYTFLYTIQDTTKGTAVAYTPTLVPDNAGDTTRFQNALALSFSYLSIPLLYDMNAADTYKFTLQATRISDGLVSANTITAIPGGSPTPEPATFGLAGAALVGLGIMRRRKQVKGATVLSQ